MRNLALLLLVVLALLLVLKFFPSEAAQGKEVPSDEITQLLERPGGSNPAPTLETPDEGATPAVSAPTEASQEPAEQAPEPEVAPEAAVETQVSEPVDWDPRREVGLAGALLHGTRGELESAIASLGGDLPPGRAAMARSYHRALAGDPDRARSLAQGVGANATTDEEQRLLALALGGRGSVPQAASFSIRSGGPVARAMAIGLGEREAAMALEDKLFGEAAVGYSDVLKATLSSPWKAEREDLRRWSSALHEAQARHRWNPNGDWPGEEVEVRSGDSLVRIRLRFIKGRPGAVMCTGLIAKANRLRSSTIHPGDPLRIPTAQVTALVDLGARWVLYMHDGEVVYSWECAIGKDGNETMTGDFTIGAKIPEPPWTRIGHPIIPYGDERNLLGTRWLAWMRDGRSTGLGFHGTWDPDSLGSAASDGCVRLRNDNVELLFDLMPEGAAFVVRE